MAGSVTVRVFPQAISEIARDPHMAQALMRLSEVHGFLADAEATAPHRTGAGAASIHAEPVLEPEGWTLHASWDKAHYYMRFHDLGSRDLAATHFLEHALDRHAHMA